MKTRQRPISPFMIGPYYKPQLTSMLSITHRLTGVLLSLVAAPILVVWLMALAAGPQYYQQVMAWLGSIAGLIVCVACLFSLIFHMLNGMRHLVWDMGKWLDLKSAYASGWAVLVLTVILTSAVVGAML